MHRYHQHSRLQWFLAIYRKFLKGLHHSNSSVELLQTEYVSRVNTSGGVSLIGDKGSTNGELIVVIGTVPEVDTVNVRGLTERSEGRGGVILGTNVFNELLTVENGVELGGLISEDMTLYPNVHYIVTKTLAIQQGAVLTILPGTVIKLKEGVSIKAPFGTIDCAGTPDSLITFTMSDGETGYASQIYLDGKIEYVKFTGLNLTEWPAIYSPDAVNCIIENCNASSYLLSGGSYTKCNIFYNTAGTQLYANGAFPMINSNICANIYNNGSDLYDNLNLLYK